MATEKQMRRGGYRMRKMGNLICLEASLGMQIVNHTAFVSFALHDLLSSYLGSIFLLLEGLYILSDAGYHM